MTRPLPDFCVIGAMKCGTTSFADALRAHPGIFVPGEKSANYFGLGDRAECEPGLVPLRSTAVRSLPAYRRRYRHAKPAQLCGDFSETAYFLPGAARAIAESNPGARIILITRDPVLRAYSAFNHARAHGLEPCSEFLQALQRPERPDTLPMLRYAGLGDYADARHRFRAVFGPASVLVLRLEDLVRCPDSAFRAVSRHLRVPVRDLRLPRQNRSVALPVPLADCLARMRSRRSKLPISKPLRRAAGSVRARIFPSPRELDTSDYLAAQVLLGLGEPGRCPSTAA